MVAAACGCPVIDLRRTCCSHHSYGLAFAESVCFRLVFLQDLELEPMHRSGKVDSGNTETEWAPGSVHGPFVGSPSAKKILSC